jgi:AAA+ ATPase superfamily predicted ATPase
MFHGRSAELKKLNEMYVSGEFEFAIVYGRRRVGKTTLIREFIKDKKALFFVGSESTADDNLASLSRCIGGKSSAPVYQNYESALSAIFESAADERLVFVIDEYPYLAESFRGASSILQILIDRHKDASKLFIILCGSSMSFMENQVLGYKSPLYGRRTAQFRVLPFIFFESLPFLDGFPDIDKAVMYGVTGGIPEYLNKLSAAKTVRGNIVDLALSPSGHFFEEPTNLIKQELREPSTYNVIIEAIAHGASRLNEISTKSRLESNKCAKYLTSLIALGLVKKEYPFGETGGKRSIYRLEDNMFRFWYRFVFPNISAVISGIEDGVFDSEVAPHLNSYMGLVFEDICKQYMFELARRGETPFFVGNMGRWWGTNPSTRAQDEIDIISLHNDSAIFAECKWRDEDAGMDVYSELKRKSGLFRFGTAYYYIFVKSGFKKELLRLAHELQEVKLLTIGDMIWQYASDEI